MLDTYSIAVWDHEEDDWDVIHSGLSKWGIRRPLLELYASGYTQISIRVWCETEEKEAARWDRGFLASMHNPYRKTISRMLASMT